MRSVYVQCVVSACCVLVWAHPACAESSSPYQALFTTVPLTAASVNVPPGGRAAPDLAGAMAVLDGQAPAAQQPAEKPPKPSRTGFGALVYTTAADFKAFPRRKSTWVILGIGAASAAIVHPFDEDLNDHFSTSSGAGVFGPGKYIGSFYVQLGTASGLYIIGRYVLPHAEGEPKTNRVSHLGFDMVRALVVSQALTQGMKYAFQRDRPTGECCAFPSGHASAAFATASVLERHLGYRGAWPTFVIASYVAASRLKDNRHFLSDVVFGSAVGIASGWTVVGRHGRSEYAMVPVPVRGGMMIAFQSRDQSQHGR